MYKVFICFIKIHRTTRFSLVCFPTVENHGSSEPTLQAGLEGAAGAAGSVLYQLILAWGP